MPKKTTPMHEFSWSPYVFSDQPSYPTGLFIIQTWVHKTAYVCCTDTCNVSKGWFNVLHSTTCAHIMKGTKFWQCFIYQNLFYILFVWCYAQTPRFMYFSWTEIFLPLCTIILCHVTLSVYPAKTQSKNCGWLLTSAQVFNSTSLLQPPVSLNFLQIGFRSPILQVTTELVVAYWHWTLLVLHIAHEVHSLRKVHKKLAEPTGNQTFSCALLTWQTCFSSSEISL
jgi:hypothetical protein